MSARAPRPSEAPELARFALVRAARFPLERLETLGRSEAPRDEATYEAILAEERRLLRAATLEDPEFQRALALSHPELAAQAAAWDPSSPRRKRLRHLETTLYRYLARAVGRTDPCGTLSGVSVARFATATRLVREPERIVLTPDLAPWQALLRALGRREAYLLRARWCPNPTVTETSPGLFVFWTRPEGAEPSKPRRLRATPAVAEAIHATQDGRAERGFRIAARFGGVPNRAGLALFCRLARAGLFVGGLDLVAEEASAWRALSRVELFGAERQAWRQAVRDTREIARRLERAFSRSTASDVLAEQARARAVLERLHAGLGLDDAPPSSRAPLRADATMPFRIELGREVEESIFAAIDTYQGRTQASPSTAIRGARHARRRAELGPGRPAFEMNPCDAGPCDAGPGDAGPCDAGPRESLDCDPAKLGGEGRSQMTAGGNGEFGDALVTPAPATGAEPPLGAAMFRGLTGAHLDGIFDEPAALYGRFAHLLGQSGDPIHAWLAGAYVRLERETGMEWVELIGPHDTNPNVLARRPLLAHRVSLWRAIPGGRSLEMRASSRMPRTDAPSSR